MNNLGFIPDLTKIRQFYDDNEKKVRMAALILLVGVSILFFWVRGSGRTVEIQGAGEGIPDAQEDEYEYTEEEKEELQSRPSSGFIYVDISGEVHKPGVYKVTSDTRLFEVIEMAGGLTDDADDNSLNRAERVEDGQKVIVISREEAENRAQAPVKDESSSSSYYYDEGKVNLNTADLSELQTLPGIGPSKAQSIIDHREKNGYFTSAEEIMNVSGIGQKTYASIKDLIVV